MQNSSINGDPVLLSRSAEFPKAVEWRIIISVFSDLIFEKEKNDRKSMSREMSRKSRLRSFDLISYLPDKIMPFGQTKSNYSWAFTLVDNSVFESSVSIVTAIECPRQNWVRISLGIFLNFSANKIGCNRSIIVIKDGSSEKCILKRTYIIEPYII